MTAAPATKKILIVNLCGIGDTLFFLPALYSIRRHWPGARIDYLVQDNAAYRIIERIPFVHHLWKMKIVGGVQSVGRKSHLKGLLSYGRLIQEIRRENYDISLWNFAETTYRKMLLGYFLGSKLNIMHSGRGFFSRSSLSRKNVFIPVDYQKHIAYRNLDLLKPLDIPPALFSKLEIDFTADENKTIEKFSETYPRDPSGRKLLIGIHPGGNFNYCRFRAWPPEYYAELTDRLQSQGHTCLYFGTSEDADVFEKIHRAMRTPFRKCDTLSLTEQCGVLTRVDRVIGNDSSVVHIASAVGTPALIIQGPSNPKSTGAWLETGFMARAQLPCSPCTDFGFHWQCPYHYCLKVLTPEYICKVVERMNQEIRGQHVQTQLYEMEVPPPVWEPAALAKRQKAENAFLKDLSCE